MPMVLRLAFLLLTGPTILVWATYSYDNKSRVNSRRNFPSSSQKHLLLNPKKGNAILLAANKPSNDNVDQDSDDYSDDDDDEYYEEVMMEPKDLGMTLNWESAGYAKSNNRKKGRRRPSIAATRSNKKGEPTSPASSPAVILGGLLPLLAVTGASLVRLLNTNESPDILSSSKKKEIPATNIPAAAAAASPRPQQPQKRQPVHVHIPQMIRASAMSLPSKYPLSSLSVILKKPFQEVVPPPKKSWAQWLLSLDKLPWTLNVLVSLVYAATFVSRVSCDYESNSGARKICWDRLAQLTSGLHKPTGVCLWEAPETSCSTLSSSSFFRHTDSHFGSFVVDSILACLTLLVGLATGRHNSITKVSGIALFMALHGLQHLSMSNGVLCDKNQQCLPCWMSCPDGTATTAPSLSWQWITTTALSNLGFVVLNFVMANFQMSLVFQTISVAVITAFLMALALFVARAAMTSAGGGTIDWSFPAAFVQSHLLLSITGLFANQREKSPPAVAAVNSFFSPLTGWCFLAATCMGMMEFLACKPALLQRYGHVWYDVVLHLAFMTTLVPPRQNHVDKKKNNKLGL